MAYRYAAYCGARRSAHCRIGWRGAGAQWRELVTYARYGTGSLFHQYSGSDGPSRRIRRQHWHHKPRGSRHYNFPLRRLLVPVLALPLAARPM